jgi:CBS domain-containing protein
MSFVESYRGHLKSDDESHKPHTHSQTVESNLMDSGSGATVGTVLEDKGRTIHSVGPTDTVAAAVKMLKEHRIGAVVVVGTDGGLLGILSERDIVRRLDEDGGHTLTLPVSELMTAQPVTCTSSERLLEMMQRMTEGRFRHLPVVDNGKLAGIITIGDVVKNRLLELEYEALKMRQMIVG